MNGSMRYSSALGLRSVINAAGKMTALGASILSDQTAAAMVDGGQHFVDLAELMSAADRRIAEATGAEAGFITSCAAAGIVITTAACITRGDIARTESLPFVPSPPDQMIIQRGHSVHFGGSILQMMAMAGAHVVEVGATNRTQPHQLEQAIDERTAGIMFVVSHHTYPGGTVSLEEVMEIAHRQEVPVVVDAAAETDLHKYIAAGVDLVIYSGHKGINAPTSGIVAGKRKWINACYQQNSGIGRAMKIGKEAILGTLAALEQGQDSTEDASAEARPEALASMLEEIPGLTTQLATDATRPEIVRLRLYLDPQQAALTAHELVSRLEAHSPSIRTRNHKVAQGVIEVDFRTLLPGEEQDIADAVREYLRGEGHYAQ